MQLTFCGGAGEVTGSCHLVETGKIAFLSIAACFREAGIHI